MSTLDSYGSSPEPTPKISSTHESGLRRGLSARQVQMIAVAGTIGTGLFLGTGKSLAQGGPASLLICYSIIGFIVYVTLLLLGEMATQYPVAGSFNAYAIRFLSPSYGFALSWNYWANDAVSVASDLTAAQLVLKFWTDSHPWLISLTFWLFLVGVNATTVRAYGELEYWLSSLKVLTIVIFILLGLLVNTGLNPSHAPLGFSYWSIPGAPFAHGFGGFARVFVTASFAYGGTESLGITAGETADPTKNMPRVVKFVFWRILVFYVASVLIIGMNVPWDYPNLSNESTTTSPFTLVFKMAGSNGAASIMNTVILSSVLSAGNHALFAGTRVLYSLASTTSSPSSRPLAPRIFARTTADGVPLPALLATASVSALCFGSAFVGGGVLWAWLQNIVGVSNQIAWFSIGLASWRFRRAWVEQGRPVEEMKFRAGWTWGWGPPFVIISVGCLILIQGWSSLFPVFKPVEFVSYYIEIPTMVSMYFGWRWVTARSSRERARGDDTAPLLRSPSSSSPENGQGARWWGGEDWVDTRTVDLYEQEFHRASERESGGDGDGDEDEGEGEGEDARREVRLGGQMGVLWAVWYSVV